MENELSSIEIIEAVKKLLNELPSKSHWNYVVQYIDIENIGNGQNGYNILKDKFVELDLTEPLEYADLDKKIKRKTKESVEIENKLTNLTAILGERTEGDEGSIAYDILQSLKTEIQELSTKRNNLQLEISKIEAQTENIIEAQKDKETSLIKKYQEKSLVLENSFKDKEGALNLKLEKRDEEIKSKIAETEKKANEKVKLINQFRDFLEETNKNMKLYSCVIIGLLIAVILAVGFSVPNLLKVFESYDSHIARFDTKITNWQILNLAFGLFIVKLPWALCLSAVLTGMYSLLRGLLITYEKINQDKRNMSAIYAISSNVANSLNEYGISIAEVREVEEGESQEVTIKVTKKNLDQKKEDIKWNHIINYFEKMQQNKLDEPISDEPSKLKIVSDILNKVIDKFPKT